MYNSTLYPNLEFSIGRVPRTKGTSRFEREYDEASNDSYVSGGLSSDGTYNDTTEVEIPHNQRIYRFIKPSELRPSRNRKYGGRGIRSSACRKIRNLVYVLDTKYKHQGFYTCTIPSIPDNKLRILQENWGIIVNKLFRNLSKIFSKEYKKKLDYVYVCEIQEKRSNKEGRELPHIHFVMPAKLSKNADFWITANRLRLLWQNILEGYLGNETEYNFGASIDCQLVRKSVCAYFSKYLSKSKSKSGANNPNDVAAIDECSEVKVWHISRYWGKSEQLGRELQSSLIKSSGEVCMGLLELCRESNPVCMQWAYPIYIQSEMLGERLVGYSGQLTELGFEILMSYEV